MKRLAFLLVFVSTTALALPDVLRSTDPHWRQWGSGDMRWFGFSLYRATLWVAGESLESAPSALQLDYRHDIPGARLVQTSSKEMRRLGAAEQQVALWAAQLQRIFPDISAGESLVGVNLPGVGARFYHGEALLGVIDDPEFARYFFAIWLDPNSRSPELRAALLSRATS